MIDGSKEISINHYLPSSSADQLPDRNVISTECLAELLRARSPDKKLLILDCRAKTCIDYSLASSFRTEILPFSRAPV
ncbi:hypothetical protein L596_005102 [Steinernema carpocapsae]|uniref:Uncharacterized protein n=1 Tax=Steinernema carpocapsae TaxID=34508 RepID=A0A4U8UXW2_STECR|nr:hypothetical protein L596_005102 [Steinernema carpocapsae]